jgi:hypothetical protein
MEKSQRKEAQNIFIPNYALEHYVVQDSSPDID